MPFIKQFKLLIIKRLPFCAIHRYNIPFNGVNSSYSQHIIFPFLQNGSKILCKVAANTVGKQMTRNHNAILHVHESILYYDICSIYNVLKLNLVKEDKLSLDVVLGR